MAKEDNLIPFTSEQSREKAKTNGRKGGIASGKAKRKKKLIKECLDELLEKDWENRKGEKHSGAEAISIALFKKALAGDMKAFELVRDSAGQKPVDKVMLAEVDQETINAVEKIMDEVENEE